MFTREQVQAMAPDASSLKAANGLASDNKWISLGANGQAIWGECKGSGAKPYQTQVELPSAVTRCSCPSRKFPCKHALALLLMSAQQVPRMASASEPPQWVTEWLASRQERAAKREEKAANTKPADPAKLAANAAKRQNTRWQRMENGAQELQRWLTDQFQRGFASFEHKQSKNWQDIAARMVDAQAPGLARYIQNALQIMLSGKDQQQYAIEQLGLLQLLLTAALRKQELSQAQQADVQTAMGWALDKEDIQLRTTPVTDQWLVLGQKMHELDARLTERRIWLWGQTTKQYALLLDFAFQGRGLEWLWKNNQSYQATLAYYPGSVPMRAISIHQGKPIPAQPGTGANTSTDWPDIASTQSFELASTMYAMNPWLPQVPVLLPETHIIPIPDENKWLAHTTEGYYYLSIQDKAAWELMAYTAGQPLTLFAEWNGRNLCPLSAKSQQHKNRQPWFNLNEGGF